MRPYGVIHADERQLNELYEDMRVELYNLQDDLSETRELAKGKPKKAAARHTLRQHRRQSRDAQRLAPSSKFER